MSHTNPQPPPNLDAYLDGVLDPAAREAFERAMRADPALAGQVALQRKINQSLGRLFEASAGAAVGASATPARRIAFRPVYWSIAAAVLLACGLAAYFYIARPVGGPAGDGPLPAVYQAQMDKGFVPEKVCTTVPEFADWVNQYFGQRLYPPEKHEGIEFLGWNYAAAVSSNSGVLLAKVEGKPVVMIVDRKVREKKPLPLPVGPGLRAFKREIGSVVLYEVTPLDHPAILPILSTRPEGGGGG